MGEVGDMPKVGLRRNMWSFLLCNYNSRSDNQWKKSRRTREMKKGEEGDDYEEKEEEMKNNNKDKKRE